MGIHSRHCEIVLGHTCHLRFPFASLFLHISVCALLLSSLPSIVSSLPIQPHESGFGPGFSPCADSCQSQLTTHCTIGRGGQQVTQCLCSQQMEEDYFNKMRRCLDSCAGKHIKEQMLLMTAFRHILCFSDKGGENTENNKIQMEYYRERYGAHWSESGSIWRPTPTDPVPPSPPPKENTISHPSQFHVSTRTITRTTDKSKRDAPTNSSDGRLTPEEPLPVPSNTNSHRNDSSSRSNFSNNKMAGVVAGSAAGGISILSVFALYLFCCHRKRDTGATSFNRDSEHGKTKSLEFLTLNLENSQNPWIQYPKSGIPTVTIESNASKKQDSPKKVMGSRGKSSASQAMRKFRDSLTSIIPIGKTGDLGQPGTVSGSHGLRWNAPPPWAQGSLNGKKSISSIDYLGNSPATKELALHSSENNDISPTESLTSVDELIGVAVTKAKTCSLPNSYRDSHHSSSRTSVASSSSSSKRTTKSGLCISLTVTEPPPLRVSTLPPALTFTNRRNPPPPLPTAAIPVPSATETATAKLASYALFHQNLVRYSSPDISPLSTNSFRTSCCDCQTDCEVETPQTPNHVCATGHSSCVWSCSSSAASSPRMVPTQALSIAERLSMYNQSPEVWKDTTLNNYTLPSPSSSAVTTICSESVSDNETIRLTSAPAKLRRQRLQLQAAEGELPPSPRRLPEEVVGMRREQQDEVLRRLYGEMAGGSSYAGVIGGGGGRRKGSISSIGGSSVSSNGSTIKAADAVYARYGSGGSGGGAMGGGGYVQRPRKLSEANVQFGVYGSSWPERI